MKKSLLIISLGLALTACGGGGGSGGNSAPKPKSNPTPVNSNITPKKEKPSVQPNINKEMANTSDNVAKSINFVREDLKDAVRNAKFLEVEGIKLALSEEPIGFVEKDLNNGLKGRAYNQAYSSIGHVLPKDVKTDKYGRIIDSRISKNDSGLFGLSTEFRDLPASGKAIYNGIAFGANTEGKLNFEANFSDKTVSGKIYDRKLIDSNQPLADVILNKGILGQLDLGADGISHFRGGVTYSDDNTSKLGGYAGKFYGPNGEEILGSTVLFLNGQFQLYENFAGKVEGEMPKGDTIATAEFNKSQEDLKKQLSEADKVHKEVDDAMREVDQKLAELNKQLSKNVMDDAFDTAAEARKLEGVKLVDSLPKEFNGHNTITHNGKLYNWNGSSYEDLIPKH